MTEARWERVKRAFHGALERPASERQAWVADACGHDPELIQEAQALLDAHETAATFLGEPAALEVIELDTFVPGTRLGQYQILSEIGRGGMGVVYLADDTQLHRRVALKALPASVAADPGRRARLWREARAAAAISHPAVATVYACQDIDHHLIIVSEYVAGETLRQAIARGGMRPERARGVAMQMALALAAAHDAGVIHRDLKPDNVILTDRDEVKIVDFGIAQVDGPAATRLTRAGAVLGTPAYMAPEQLLGREVDARADIYAFGVILAELVTGRHPLQSPAIDGSSPHALAAIWIHCMQPGPEARYTSARELVEALAGSSRADVAPRPDERAQALWWWQFHQGAAALVYWLMAAPSWQARHLLPGLTGRTFFILALASIILASTLRLHLWFTSRFYPGHLDWTRRRTRSWLRRADWVFAGTLVGAGLALGDTHGGVAVLLLAVGVGTVVAFAVIEPSTARAAFGPTPHSSRHQ